MATGNKKKLNKISPESLEEAEGKTIKSIDSCSYDGQWDIKFTDGTRLTLFREMGFIWL